MIVLLLPRLLCMCLLSLPAFAGVSLQLLMMMIGSVCVCSMTVGSVA